MSKASTRLLDSAFLNSNSISYRYSLLATYLAEEIRLFFKYFRNTRILDRLNSPSWETTSIDVTNEKRDFEDVLKFKFVLV